MLKLAAVQAASIFLNKTATTQKAVDLIHQAGAAGVNVIGFPEAFIPGYPGWNALLPDADPLSTSLYLQLFANAVEVPGPEVTLLQNACREANIAAVIGINERRPNTTGTLFNTQLTISSTGSLLLKHQKLVPTVGERLIHAPGTTGSDCAANVGEEVGTVSGLICAENGNMLSQYAAALEYPIVHIASWPQFLAPGQDVADLIDVAGKAVALSVGTYVINAASVVHDSEIEMYGTTEELRAYMKEEQGRRRARIFAPGGRLVAEGSEDEKGRGEEIVYAEVEEEAVRGLKMAFDWAGHYQRPEVFRHLFEGL